MDLDSTSLASGFFVFVVFFYLLVKTLMSAHSRLQLLHKLQGELILDAISLLIQGFGIPTLRALLVLWILPFILPKTRGFIDLSFELCFLIGFVLVDYLYYWNHRLLHTNFFWRWHAVHHSIQTLDVTTTSRNSLLSHFLFVYLWVIGLLIYVISDPAGLIWSASLTAALDLWRHSNFKSPRVLTSTLGYFMIMPEDHRQHHSQKKYGVNFGANFKIWDCFHGTYCSREQWMDPAFKLGVPLEGSVLNWLLATHLNRSSESSHHTVNTTMSGGTP